MISVVIPLYNKGHVIVNTIKTVLAQEYTDFELIIVDDGSTDDGVEVIKREFTDESRIRIISQENQGVSAARNRGIEEAKGEYISLLDGDDEWHPKYLQHVVGMIKEYPYAGMFCTAGLVQNANGSTGYRIVQKYIGKTLEIEYFENPDKVSHTSATTLSRKLFLKSNKFPVGQNFSEDYSCFYEMGLMAPVIYCGIPLSKYIGGVEGQATSVLDYSYRAPHIIRMMNTFASQVIFYNNRSALIFLKYTLRHYLKLRMLEDMVNFMHFYSNLSEVTKCNFSALERFIYQHIPKLAPLYINITKVRWRMRGYPIVGESVNTNKLEKKYLQW